MTQEQFKKELEELLEAHAAKTSAYYRKENFGCSEDEDQEWDACYEEGYQDLKYEFIEKYGK
jgi:hypothetical protein